MSASAEPDLPVSIREATADDRGFVIQAWIRGYQRSKEVGDLRGSEYSPLQRAFMNRMLARGRTLLAVNADDPTQFYGFIVFETEPKVDIAVIHWVYVKDTFRSRPPDFNVGIGRRLIVAAVGGYETVYYTARAPRRADEEKLRRGGARFNPYLR